MGSGMASCFPGDRENHSIRSPPSPPSTHMPTPSLRTWQVAGPNPGGTPSEGSAREKRRLKSRATWPWRRHLFITKYFLRVNLPRCNRLHTVPGGFHLSHSPRFAADGIPHGERITPVPVHGPVSATKEHSSAHAVSYGVLCYMQVLRVLTRQPVLLFDSSHYVAHSGFHQRFAE